MRLSRPLLKEVTYEIWNWEGLRKEWGRLATRATIFAIAERQLLGRSNTVPRHSRAKKKGHARACPWSMREMESGLAFGEAGYGFGFRVVDLKHGEKLGNLQDFLKLAAEMAEA